MPKYMETAAEANKTAVELFELVCSNDHPRNLQDPSDAEYLKQVSCLIARLVNYGMRCCPRPAQSTVRLNAVKRSVQGLPVSVRMETKETDSGHTYNALITE